MGRSALFVDAGFLLAWGAARIAGAGAPRLAVGCDYPRVVQLLWGACVPQAGPSSDLLRIYWYDGAPDQMATPEQVTIGNLDNVKLRLGRLTPAGQKGVDTLIVLDLTTLAREKAIDTAFLLSGDDDLREAVIVAQHSGVRVVLLGLANIGGTRQSKDLIREADRIVDVTAVVEPCFTHVVTPPYLDGQAFSQALFAATPAMLPGLTQLKASGARLVIPQPDEQLLKAQVKQALKQRGWRRADLDPWHMQEARRAFWDLVP